MSPKIVKEKKERFNNPKNKKGVQATVSIMDIFVSIPPAFEETKK